MSEYAESENRAFSLKDTTTTQENLLLFQMNNVLTKHFHCTIKAYQYNIMYLLQQGAELLNASAQSCEVLLVLVNLLKYI